MGLTEVTNEMRLCCIWCPLSVDYLTTLLDVETHLVKPSGKFLIPALVLIDGIFPLLKALVAVSDSWDERLKVPIEF